MPDEYLPPNKVLFLQNLPEGTTKEDLQDVFEQYVQRKHARVSAVDVSWLTLPSSTPR